jgi:hypothetical protein
MIDSCQLTAFWSLAFLFQTNRPGGSQSNLSTIGIDDGGYGGGIGGSITGISLGNSIENIQVGGMTGMTSGGMTLIGNVSSSGGGRLLAPDFNAVASRHGSLPNVGERVQVSLPLTTFTLMTLEKPLFSRWPRTWMKQVLSIRTIYSNKGNAFYTRHEDEINFVDMAWC